MVHRSTAVHRTYKCRTNRAQGNRRLPKRVPLSFPSRTPPRRTQCQDTPLTPIMAAEGAEFTVVNGWERVDYIKPSPDFHPSLSFNFDETFDIVGAEVRNVQENVGLCEVNGFNRFEITGADRHSFLDRMFCGAVTKKDGRIGLGYLLNHYGMIKGEATIANIPASDRGPARCLVWIGSGFRISRHGLADPAFATGRRREDPQPDQRSDNPCAGRPQSTRCAFGLRPWRLVQRGIPIGCRCANVSSVSRPRPC